jgi:hypothetical protein
LLSSARQTKADAPESALRLCLGCRGYVCDECWNEPASVCQTCQPLDDAGTQAPSVLDEYTPPPNGLAFAGEAAWADGDETARLSAMTSWPASDLRRPGASVEPPLELVETEAELAAEPRQFFCPQCRTFVRETEVKRMGLVGQPKRNLCPKCGRVLEREPTVEKAQSESEKQVERKGLRRVIGNYQARLLGRNPG